MIEKDSVAFINTLTQLNMVVSRFLTRSKQDEAKKVIKNTSDYFNNNRKNHHIEVVFEALQVMVHNYGEFQYKIPLDCDFGKFITGYLNYYMDELKKIKIKK